ncbi:Bro-N domain-containing protein [Phenylobacterium sp.]|uniref:BRO-N domain-containing protein n=1 Tax=Phenylobacterium sp. TaxID=1871053 RepID=UPI003926AD9F
MFKDDEVRTVRREQTLSDGVSSSLLFTGTAGRLRILSESGLYKLVMRSDKKEALVFQDWVTREVLPSIRKTGGYQLADHGRTEMPLPADLAVAIQQLAAAQRELADRVVVALDEFRRQMQQQRDDQRMLTARQLIRSKVVTGIGAPELGRKLTTYCMNNGIPMGTEETDYGDVNTYPVSAARAWAAGRKLAA